MDGKQIRTHLQMLARVLLGAILIFAGYAHLTISRVDFLAQVPPWLPMDPQRVVYLSGIVEILLGAALIVLHRQRVYMGWIVAFFFVAVFPGNIAQYMYHRNSFNLNTDGARLFRLCWEPLLWVWPLWATGAWTAFRQKRKAQQLQRRVPTNNV